MRCRNSFIREAPEKGWESVDFSFSGYKSGKGRNAISYEIVRLSENC